MIPTPPMRSTGTCVVVTCLATLTLALAACSGVNPAVSPSATANGGTGTEPSASVASSDSPSPSAPATPSSGSVTASTAGPATASTAAATQPQTIHLIVHPINDTAVSVGSLTGCTDPACQGDFIIGNDPLVDAATGANAGTMAYECFVVDPASTLYHCPGNTFTLTGRGQIVFTESIVHEVGGAPTTAPITGGTGEFLGVTGVVTASKVAEGGDFVITFTK
jgi:hypothetical protein